MQTLTNPLKDLADAFVVVHLRDFGERSGFAREIRKSSIHDQVDHIARTLIACAGRIKDLVGGAVEGNGHVVAAIGVGHASSWHARPTRATEAAA